MHRRSPRLVARAERALVHLEHRGERQLGERLGQDQVAAHHGSLSRERRQRVDERVEEQKAKTDPLKLLHVQVFESQYNLLRDLAHERRISLAEMTRQALSEWINRPLDQ